MQHDDPYMNIIAYLEAFSREFKCSEELEHLITLYETRREFIASHKRRSAH